MKYIYKGEEVLVIKKLHITDKDGEWIQIEFLSGPNKGSRKPIAVKSDKLVGFKEKHGAVVQ